MWRAWEVMVMAGFLGLGAGSARAAQAVVGQPAPEFSVTDTQGTSRSLSSMKGKFVVLEWFNPDCPFVRKHYDSQNMQTLQRAATQRGGVWLSINSSAPKKQGHLTPETANAFVQARAAAPTAVLLDPAGTVGRQYGAKTTPHMFVINPDGVLVYAGAIDSVSSTDPKDIAQATNYVQRALDEALAGQPVSAAETQSYGCSVKY